MFSSESLISLHGWQGEERGGRERRKEGKGTEGKALSCLFIKAVIPLQKVPSSCHALSSV